MHRKIERERVHACVPPPPLPTPRARVCVCVMERDTKRESPLFSHWHVLDEDILLPIIKHLTVIPNLNQNKRLSQYHYLTFKVLSKIVASDIYLFIFFFVRDDKI